MKKKTKILLPRYRMGMTVAEYDKAYSEDIDTMKRRFLYHFQKVRQKALKAVKFPLPFVVKEQHGIEECRGYFSLSSKKQVYKEGVDINAVIYFKNNRGLCAYINLDPLNRISRVENVRYVDSHRYLFTPHFFERYEERNGRESGCTDIHDQFFFNNIAFPGMVFVTQHTKAREGDYKTIDVWSLCEEGLMLGELKSEEDYKAGRSYVMQINTFLDVETLTHRQEKYKDILIDIKEVYEKLKNSDIFGNGGQDVLSFRKRIFLSDIFESNIVPF